MHSKSVILAQRHLSCFLDSEFSSFITWWMPRMLPVQATGITLPPGRNILGMQERVKGLRQSYANLAKWFVSRLTETLVRDSRRFVIYALEAKRWMRSAHQPLVHI